MLEETGTDKGFGLSGALFLCLFFSASQSTVTHIHDEEEKQ